MAFYKEKIEEVISKLKTNIKTGLTKKQISNRLKKYGFNIIPTKKTTNPFFIFIRQFINPLMFILLIATIISFLIGEIKDSIIISIAVIINITIGFFQEWKAEKALHSLKNFEVHYCNVKRNEKIISIKAKNLVPGDIVLLSAGTKIPADLRLFHVINFQVEEAILTGESKPIKKNISEIKKDAIVADRTNMVFSGTNVLSGKAEGIVVKTGTNTYLGQIAKLVSETKEPITPLQKQIKKLSWWIGGILLAIIGMISILGFARGIPFYKIIMIGIALSVAAIPEGLLIGVTVILAIGMQRMLKRHALVRHLSAAETLGSVSVICTDKTGTLTKGQMQVVKIITKNNIFTAKDFSKKSNLINNKELIDIAISSILNNDAQLKQNSNNAFGQPTEIALLLLANSMQFNIKKIREKHERINEIPFSSDLKYMATINKFDDHEKLIIKGAPEKIFAMCKQDETTKKFKKLENKMTHEGLRILAIAINSNSKNKINLKKDLRNLDCIGLIGIQDPLRTQAKSTIKELNKAGIKVIIVTGDHKDTTASIAKKAGIEFQEENILTGSQLDKITEKQLTKIIPSIIIFARVDPRHKIRIVQAWQSFGKSVAMTGDGVNDAPALKAADIGVALGSGSDVAHEISDIVLLDNNLSSIDSAVKEGRTIFDNIRKVIVYLMTDSFSEIVLIGGAILFNLPLPLLASQIFWVNLISDGLPYLALTVEPAEPEIMQERPRNKNEPIINRDMKILIFIIGIITDIGLFLLFLFLLKNNFNLQHIRTIMFTSIAIDSLFYVFSIKNMHKTIFKMDIFSNRWLIPCVISGFLLQLSVVYIPILQKLFSTTSMNFFEWIMIIFISLIKITAIEISKKYFFTKKNYYNAKKI